MPSSDPNFEGVGNAAAASPPDTEGDIGPNHYMQWVNLSFRIYNRNGTPASAGHAGLPALHRPAASAEARPETAATRSSSTTSSRTAGSRRSSRIRTIRTGRSTSASPYSSTRRPDGHLVRLPVHRARDQASTTIPKFGVWPTQHAYMITVNQFSEPGDGWAGVGVFALERDAMMSGCGSARMLYKDMFPVEPNLWGGMLPADLDGDTLPPANAPAPLIEVDAQEWDPAHFPQDRLDVWNATVDWTGPARSTSATRGRFRRRRSTGTSATSPPASRSRARR